MCRSSVVNIVDLAGSERIVSDNQNLNETAFINKSLFQLGNVIAKLSANHKKMHVPFRDSKLTRIL